MMNVVISAKDKHIIFNRDLCAKYSYECKKEKISYYVYSLLEAICLRCSFFTWEEIRKYIIYFINLALTIFQYIEEKPFDELVKVQQDVHDLAKLQIYQGLFNSLFILIYSLLFVIYLTATRNVHGEKSTIKNSKPEAEKLMIIKKGLFKHVMKDRYWGNQAPLFVRR